MVLPLVAAVWAASTIASVWGARETYLAGEAWTEALEWPSAPSGEAVRRANAINEERGA